MMCFIVVCIICDIVAAVQGEIVRTTFAQCLQKYFCLCESLHVNSNSIPIIKQS